MGKRYKKLLIQEVALAGNPVNREKFLLVKDGGVSMNEKVKLASLILMKEDVPEVVKEELKDFVPKTGEVVELTKDLNILVKDDGDFEIQNKLNEKVNKLEKDLKDALEKVSDEDKRDILTKDMPKEVKERFEKLEKDIREAKEAEKKAEMKVIKKDLTDKVGSDIADVLMKNYNPDITNELADKIAGLQKMVKDLSKTKGKTGDDIDKEKKIKEGIERIKKEKGIESDTDAYVELIKEHPELG